MDLRNTYPRVVNDVVLHQQPSGAIIVRTTLKHEAPPIRERHKVDLITANTLCRCDGTRRYDDLLEEAVELEGGNLEAMTIAAKAITRGLKEGVLELLNSPEAMKVKVTGSTSHFAPIHIQFELTDRCNVNCLHCYRDCGPKGKSFIDTHSLLRLFDDMFRTGVSVIELTGGEPTLHRDIRLILEEATNRFELTALITNGWRLDSTLVRTMATLKGLIVQVDLDGDTAEIHDGLRGRPGSFRNAVRAAKLLAEHQIRFRLAMNVYEGNVHAIGATAELAQVLGATWFTFSPVIDVGRGRSIGQMSIEQAREIHRLAKSLPQRFPKGFLFVSMDQLEAAVSTNAFHCGAGWRSLAISPEGNVRPCVMMDPNAVVLGNVFESEYEAFLNSCPTMFFHDMVLPDEPTCGNCRFLLFCKNCFVRPLRAMELIQEQGLGFRCRWNEKTSFTKMLAQVNSIQCSDSR